MERGILALAAPALACRPAIAGYSNGNRQLHHLVLLFSAKQPKLLPTAKPASYANFGKTSMADTRFGGASF
jgi:hypothetical protein